ncbi:UNVERIFIED_CONTAM: hypothetical protein GTU68_000897, partial [Idotea baltica]|nr:hypothetical protein [Idotea baltica]
EVIFCGRSNVGKSYLLNNIYKFKKLNRVSKKPGSTKKLYIHKLKNGHRVIDTPGYGYAKFNVDAKKMLTGMTFDYLRFSTRVVKVYLLINSHHGIKNNDIVFLKRLSVYNVKV